MRLLAHDALVLVNVGGCFSGGMKNGIMDFPLPATRRGTARVVRRTRENESKQETPTHSTCGRGLLDKNIQGDLWIVMTS